MINSLIYREVAMLKMKRCKIHWSLIGNYLAIRSELYDAGFDLSKDYDFTEDFYGNRVYIQED